jgi:hypothetical protein
LALVALLLGAVQIYLLSMTLIPSRKPNNCEQTYSSQLGNGFNQAQSSD